MRLALLLPVLAAVTVTAGGGRQGSGASSHELRSPDGRTVVVVETGTRIRWSVTRDGEPLVGPVSSALTVNGRALGRAPARRAERARADEVIQAVFYPRRELVRDRYEQLTLMFADDLCFILRVYDDGVAYRLGLDVDGALRIETEEVRIAMPGDPVAYATLADCARAAERRLDCFHSSFEEPSRASRRSRGFSRVSRRSGGSRVCSTGASRIRRGAAKRSGWRHLGGGDDRLGRAHGVSATLIPLERRTHRRALGRRAECTPARRRLDVRGAAGRALRHAADRHGARRRLGGTVRAGSRAAITSCAMSVRRRVNGSARRVRPREARCT